MTPTSPIASSTAVRAEVTMEPVSASILPVAAAMRTESSVTATKRPFSMGVHGRTGSRVRRSEW